MLNWLDSDNYILWLQIPAYRRHSIAPKCDFQSCKRHRTILKFQNLNFFSMAQDSNEPPRVRGPPPGATEPPEHVKKPQIYEIFPGAKPEGTVDGAVAGQKNTPQPSITEGFQSIKPDDIFKVHQIPCARQGLMTGIGAGAAMGMGRYFIGGT